MKKETIIKVLRNYVNASDAIASKDIPYIADELLADEPAGQVDNKYCTCIDEGWTRKNGIVICRNCLKPIKSESKQDKEQEIIKALSGEEIEDVPTFTSTGKPIEDYVVYDTEHSEKLGVKFPLPKGEKYKCIPIEQQPDNEGMSSERIKEIQKETAYPESVSVYEALLKVWNECEQYYNTKLRDENKGRQTIKGDIF